MSEAEGPEMPSGSLASADNTSDADDSSPWIIVEREPSFGRTLPYDLKALGPILTLRRHLAQVQWSSFEEQNLTSPLLARFEIVDAYGLGSPPDFVNGVPDHYDAGFIVRAIVYWAYLDAGSQTSRRSTRIVREVLPAGGIKVYQEGPRIERICIETKDYRVEPNESKRQKKDRIECIIQGETGWRVQAEPAVVASEVIEVHGNNKVVKNQRGSAPVVAMSLALTCTA